MTGRGDPPPVFLVEKAGSEKSRKKRLTKGEWFAIFSKLFPSGRAVGDGDKKVLKSLKKGLDKTRAVWYSNQAVRVAVADESAEKTSKEVEKGLDKGCEFC